LATRRLPTPKTLDLEGVGAGLASHLVDVAVGFGVGVAFVGAEGEIGSAVVVGTLLGAAGGVDGTRPDGVDVASPTDVEATDGGRGSDARSAATPAAVPATPADRTVARIAARVFTGGRLLGGRSSGER
jgi:hypothetical protein